MLAKFLATNTNKWEMLQTKTTDLYYKQDNHAPLLAKIHKQNTTILSDISKYTAQKWSCRCHITFNIPGQGPAAAVQRSRHWKKQHSCFEILQAVAAGGYQIYTEINTADMAKVNAKQLNFEMTMSLLTTLWGDFYSYFSVSNSKYDLLVSQIWTCI